MTLREAIELLLKYVSKELRIAEYAVDGDTYVFYMVEKDPTRYKMQLNKMLLGPYFYTVSSDKTVDVVPFIELGSMYDRLKDSFKSLQ